MCWGKRRRPDHGAGGAGRRKRAAERARARNVLRADRGGLQRSAEGRPQFRNGSGSGTKNTLPRHRAHEYWRCRWTASMRFWSAMPTLPAGCWIWNLHWLVGPAQAPRQQSGGRKGPSPPPGWGRTVRRHRKRIAERTHGERGGRGCGLGGPTPGNFADSGWAERCHWRESPCICWSRWWRWSNTATMLCKHQK
jgi:hypothetical protein